MAENKPICTNLWTNKYEIYTNILVYKKNFGVHSFFQQIRQIGTPNLVGGDKSGQLHRSDQQQRRFLMQKDYYYYLT